MEDGQIRIQTGILSHNKKRKELDLIQTLKMESFSCHMMIIANNSEL
jgi:uncharacterized membrane protein YdbT with pleckstrin-like domain